MTSSCAAFEESVASAGWRVRFESRMGKGSHGRLYYGNRFATVKDRRKEIGKGLLAAMLQQLGLDRQDLDRGA